MTLCPIPKTLAEAKGRGKLSLYALSVTRKAAAIGFSAALLKSRFRVAEGLGRVQKGREGMVHRSAALVFLAALLCGCANAPPSQEKAVRSMHLLLSTEIPDVERRFTLVN